MLLFKGVDNKLYFRQFANIFAKFRRGKSIENLNIKEKKLLFLFSVRIFSKVNHIDFFFIQDLRSKS